MNVKTERRGRGRPRGFDRDAALDLALQVFWRQGYEGASIADLTLAMGITAPSLYAAFGSKEALYREALARYSAVQMAETSQELAQTETAYAAVRVILMAAVRQLGDPTHPPGCMLSTAGLACAPENRPAAEAAAAYRAATLAALADRLQGALERGEIRPGVDPLALARFYGAVIQGMSVQAIDGADQAALKGIVDIALSAWPR